MMKAVSFDGFPGRLQAALEAKGYTYSTEETAAMLTEKGLKVSPTTLYLWLRPYPVTIPRIRTLQTLAAMLDVHPAYLLWGVKSC